MQTVADFIVEIEDCENSGAEKMIDGFEAMQILVGGEIIINYLRPATRIVVHSYCDDSSQLLEMINELHQQEDNSFNGTYHLTEIEIVVQGGSNDRCVFVEEIDDLQVKENETNEQGQDGGHEIDIVVLSGENENLKLREIIDKLMSGEALFVEELQNEGHFSDIQVVVLDNNLETVQMEDIETDEVLEEFEGHEEIQDGGRWGPSSEPEIVLEVYGEASSDFDSETVYLETDDEDSGSWFDVDGQPNASMYNIESNEYMFLGIMVDVEVDQNGRNVGPNFIISFCSPVPRAQNSIPSMHDPDEFDFQYISTNDDYIRSLKEKFDDVFYFEPDTCYHDEVDSTVQRFNLQLSFILVGTVLLLLMALSLLIFVQ